ncbi:MAG: RNA polymerase sigma factor [Chloroflexi bacterium]|nr:MAG: RNA polymerase sigma factor [Chloroflexota bacterium]
MTSDHILIERWKARDQQAAEALYNQYNKQIFRLAYGMLMNLADAEEVMQDTLLYALSNIQRYDSNKASFQTWLHKIAVSRCRDKRRRKQLAKIPLWTWIDKGGDAAEPQPLPEYLAIAQDNHDHIWQAVQSLSPKLVEVIILRYWAGHTFREIAEILDCPLPTAQSRAQFAHKKLRAMLQSDEPIRDEQIHLGREIIK